MNSEIILTKLKYLDANYIYDWLEKEYNKNKYNYDTELIETTLAKKNDNLINLGLIQYGENTEGLEKIYNETKDLSLKVAYLSSHNFRYGNNIFYEVLKKYQKEGSEDNEKLLIAFLTNPTISDQILTELFKKEKEFDSLENKIWLKLISFTYGNKRLNTPYNDEYMDGYAEYSYEAVFTAFWKLYEKLDVTVENAILLNDLAYKMVPNDYSINIKKCLNRWQSDENKAKKVFEDCRYYIAKLKPYYDLEKYKDSEDKALRRAYYSSNFCYKIGNEEEELCKIFEGYFDRDGDDFIYEVLYNDSLFVDKVRRTALGKVCWYSDKDNYLTNPNTFNMRCKYYLNKYPNWFEDEDDEYDNYIEEIQNKEIRTEQYLKKIYENVSGKEDSKLKIELEQIKGDIQSFQYNLDNNLIKTQNILKDSVSFGSKISIFMFGLIVGIVISYFF